MILESNPEFRSHQQSRFHEAYAVLRQSIGERAFPGCAFGVLAEGKVILLDSLGHFTYESADDDLRPVSPETLYDIASLTKVVSTTSTAMLLHQRGLLDLETPVGELLPGFVIGRDASEHARRVTVRHLLAHNAGLPGYVPFFHTATTPYAVLRGCLELPIQAEPGTRAEYSDPGFILLGKALETILGEDLAIWARREVFLPLGMTATRYCPAPHMRSEVPPTEEDELFRQRRHSGRSSRRTRLLAPRSRRSCRIVFSNVPDLLRFAYSILSPRETALFDPDTVGSFAQRQPPEGSSRALGWDTPSEARRPDNIFRPTPSVISDIQAVRSGSTGMPTWRLSFSPIEPGHIENRNRFAPFARLFTTPFAKRSNL